MKHKSLNGGRVLVNHYERCFKRFGDSYKGVDWPDQQGALLRYKVMSELTLPCSKKQISILDYGSGLGHYYKFLKKTKQLSRIRYTGMDASEIFVEAARKKFPSVSFTCGNMLNHKTSFPKKKYDFIVINGVLTERRELSQVQMISLFKNVVGGLFNYCSHGIAFNVMSKRVDWQRSDLFHLDFETMSKFIVEKLSRHFVIRHDYGLYEYTVYIYRKSTCRGSR